MTTRIWRELIDDLGDGRWQLRCPQPTSKPIAEDQGKALERALALHPDRLVFCSTPDPPYPSLEHTLKRAGLALLGQSLWVERAPGRLEGPAWEGLQVRSAADAGYPAIAEALAQAQTESSDWPELLAATSIDRRLAVLRQSPGHRPDWWFRVDEGGSVVGVALFESAGDRAVAFSFLGLSPTRRGQGWASRLFRGALAALPEHPIEGAVDSRNRSSRAMLASWGFVEDGSEQIWVRPARSGPR